MRLQLEHMEARDFNEQELFNRLKACETALSNINHDKLSPFHQQEILNRIECLEDQVRMHSGCFYTLIAACAHKHTSLYTYAHAGS